MRYQRYVLALSLSVLWFFPHSFSVFASKPIFYWVDKTIDAPLWKSLQSDFSSELKSLAAEKPTGPAPTLHRIARHQYFLLVIVEHKQGPTPTPESTYYYAFSYDLNTKKKSPVMKLGFDWKLIGTAYFAPFPMPDILFSRRDCNECEATTSLSAFQFDPNKNGWVLRTWNQIPTITIASELDHGDGSGLKYTAIFGLGDYNGDQFDDVLLWSCWYEPGQPLVEEKTTLCTIQNGVGKTIEITDPKQLKDLHKKLCEKNQDSVLCK